jgi:predicted helicase
MPTPYLHGSSKKQEVAPDGSKDENVFDIQQGVAISIFIKEPNKSGPAHVQHAEMWGTRESKYDRLSENDVANIKWKLLTPSADGYFFTPKNFSSNDEYLHSPSIQGDIFIESNTGIQTKNDGFVYQFTKEDIKTLISDLQNKAAKELIEKYDLSMEGNWSLSSAQQDTRKNNGQFVQVHYHPFDKRWTYYTGKTSAFMARPRAPLMQNSLHPNFLLLTVRNPRRGNTDSFLFTDTIVDKDGVSPFDNATFFPLYLYTTPESTQGTLFAQTETTREPNLSKEFIEAVSEKLGLTFLQTREVLETSRVSDVFTPEDIFHYIYAVFHAPTYRSRYAEFLKIDFPRVPITSNRKLFFKLAALGEELVGLHLMKSAELDNIITTYPIKGSNEVEKIRFEKNARHSEGAERPKNLGQQSETLRSAQGDKGKVFINDTQYFGGVPENVWEFHIGGYQVCDK